MSINVGIVGLGWWGKQLCDFFKQEPDVVVPSVCDINIGTKLDDPDFAGMSMYLDLETMLKKEKLDAIVISTPPTLHKEATVLAAQYGVNIFCEKPMATTIEDCEEMIRACKNNNVILMVAFKHRYAKSFAMLKKRSQSFGKSLWAMYTYPLWKVDDPGWKFKRDGTDGIIMENVVHAIDGLTYLMGTDVEYIYAEGNSAIFKYEDIPDSTVFVLRFKNGAIAAIGGGCTSDQNISREYLDIHYEGGIGQIGGMLDFPTKLRVLERQKGIVEQYEFEGSDGVTEEIEYFVNCLREKNFDPISSGSEAMKATQVAIAVLKSIRTGKKIFV